MILYEMLERTAQRSPDALAVIYGREELTYASLLDKAQKLPVRLRQLRVPVGARVGLAMHNSIEFIVALFALSSMRAEVCLFNPDWKAGQLSERIQSSGISVLICENYIDIFQKGLGQASRLKISYIERQQLFCDGKIHALRPEKCSYAQDDTILIQCSSGTTGLPKMACRSAGNISADTRNITSAYQYHPGDRVYCSVPLFHGYGLTMGLISVIFSGATLLLERWFQGKAMFLQDSSRWPTIFLGVPDIYQQLAKQAMIPEWLLRCRWLISSGDPLKEELCLRFYQKSKRWISQIYGMMEASMICANLVPDEHNHTCVGSPPSNVELKIQDRTVRVRAKTVSRMYLLNGRYEPLLDEDGFFDTGDLGLLSENNELYLHGRKK